MSPLNERRTVVGVFEEHRKAERAVNALERAGFRDDQIGIVFQQGYTEEAAWRQEDPGDNAAAEGALGGALTGGALGAAAGLAVAAGLIPGIGPALAGGLLAGVLSSAGVGAAAGGLVGGLVGLGVPEEEARYYDGEFRSGRAVVTVEAGGRYDEAWDILRSHGAYNSSTAHVVASGAVGKDEF